MPLSRLFCGESGKCLLELLQHWPRCTGAEPSRASKTKHRSRIAWQQRRVVAACHRRHGLVPSTLGAALKPRIQKRGHQLVTTGAAVRVHLWLHRVTTDAAKGTHPWLQDCHQVAVHVLLARVLTACLLHPLPKISGPALPLGGCSYRCPPQSGAFHGYCARPRTQGTKKLFDEHWSL